MGKSKKNLTRSARKSLLLPLHNFSHVGLEALYIFIYDVTIKMFLVGCFLAFLLLAQLFTISLLCFML